MTAKTKKSVNINEQKRRQNNYRRRKLKNLPSATWITLNRLSNYPARSYMLKSLNIIREDVRTRMFKILETLFSGLDWSTLRLGVAGKEYLDPISYESFIDRYEDLHKETIPRSTWYRYIKRIKDAGYLNSITANQTNSERKVLNKPAYKWFTKKFMEELGHTTEWLKQQKDAAENSLKKKKNSNQWRIFKSSTARIAHSQATTYQEMATLWYDDREDYEYYLDNFAMYDS